MHEPDDHWSRAGTHPRARAARILRGETDNSETDVLLSRCVREEL